MMITLLTNNQKTKKIQNCVNCDKYEKEVSKTINRLQKFTLK